MKLLPCLACLLLPTLVQALEPAKIKRIDALLVQLADQRHEVRDKASVSLMQMVDADPEVANHLHQLDGHKDPEVRFRIAELTRDLPVTLKWIDPAREREVKSLDMSPDRLELTVKNRSKIVIKTYWIDWEGRRQPRRTLQPGQQCTYAVTYREHYWLVTDDQDKALGLYCPGKKDAQIVYLGTEGK